MPPGRCCRAGPCSAAFVTGHGSPPPRAPPRRTRHDRRYPVQCRRHPQRHRAVAAATPEDHRDLHLAAGRSQYRRLADRVRAPDRLPTALPVLRHRLCLPRRHLVGHRRHRGRGAGPGRAPCLRDRWRAAGAEALPGAAAEAVRCRHGRLAGNLRRAGRQCSGSARIARGRHQDPGFGRSGAQPLGQPAAADRARPDQVRHLQPRGLRLGQGSAGRARAGQALHRVLLAQQGRDHRAPAGRLDRRRPAAGALPDAVA
ncbi:hypothetical protein G6F65_013351 [Rhizopus arrhizus]|nr:hypothetical protein G6F65_013351 [Rhizopus arrhizus]